MPFAPQGLSPAHGILHTQPALCPPKQGREGGKVEIPEVSWSPSLAPGDTLLGLCSGTAWPQHFLPPFSPPRGLKGRRAGVGAGVLKVGPAGGGRAESALLSPITYSGLQHCPGNVWKTVTFGEFSPTKLAVNTQGMSLCGDR